MSRSFVGRDPWFTHGFTDSMLRVMTCFVLWTASWVWLLGYRSWYTWLSYCICFWAFRWFPLWAPHRWLDELQRASQQSFMFRWIRETTQQPVLYLAIRQSEEWSGPNRGRQIELLLEKLQLQPRFYCYRQPDRGDPFYGLPLGSICHIGVEPPPRAIHELSCQSYQCFFTTLLSFWENSSWLFVHSIQWYVGDLDICDPLLAYCIPPSLLAQYIVWRAQPGSLLTLPAGISDWHEEWTIEVLKRVIPVLQERQYRIASV